MPNMIQKLKKKYNAPTPKKWRKIGEAINHLGTTLQVVAAGAQASDSIHLPGSYFLWVIGIALLQWGGTTIVNFASDDEETIDTIQNAQI